MRTAFIEALTVAAETDPRVFLVVADLGFSVVEDFARRFPARFLNSGVNEQAMVGIAAGLAMTNKRVFTYSIGNFATLRCLEQLRNDVCYHGVDVCAVAVGGGFAYGELGVTHHLTEDLAVLRALPEMRVCAPGDPAEARAAVDTICAERGPFYLRLGKAGEPMVHTAPPKLELGRMIPVRVGQDALIIATGGMLKIAVDAAEMAAARGTSTAVWSCPWLKPLDEAAIRGAAKQFQRILTLEEGQRSGGLGGAVAEVLAQMPNPRATLRILGTPDEYLKVARNQKSARAAVGLDVESVTNVLCSSGMGEGAA